MNYKDIIKDMLKPEDKLASVVDTYLTIGEILEDRQKLIDGKNFLQADMDRVILKTMYVLGFYPFYNVHGAVLRPLLIHALDTDNAIESFFVEAIPTALTIAMPQKQEEYISIRNRVREKFKG